MVKAVSTIKTLWERRRNRHLQNQHSGTQRNSKLQPLWDQPNQTQQRLCLAEKTHDTRCLSPRQ